MISYQFFINYAEHLSYLGIFILLAVVGFIVPLPEEMLLLSVGYLSALGFTSAYIGIGVSLIGVLTGDSFLFLLSKRGSTYIYKLREKFTEGNIQKYEHLMSDKIGRTIFLLRFIVGLRLFGPIVAGSLNARWSTFLVYDTRALLVYVPAFILLGYHFNNQLALIISELAIIRHIVFVIVIAIVGLGLSILAKTKFLK